VEAKPWTAIIPLNEEYYIALKELLGQKLPIIRLKSRKIQQEGHPQLLPSQPWEKYTCKEVTSLYLDFDATEPSHASFNLQWQAKRDRERRLKAVFIDELTLKVPYQLGVDELTHYEVDFSLTRTPKNSETRKAIREEVTNLKNKYHIYQDVSKRDKAFYQRIFQNPSCLEIRHIRQIANPFGSPKDTQNFLNGLTEKSHSFMCNLAYVTRNIVWDVYKRFDTQAGYILDGIVSSDEIRRRLTKEA